MLHYLDDLDSKLESMRAHFEREPEQDWTSYNPSLGRTLLNSRRILAKAAASDAPVGTAASAVQPERSSEAGSVAAATPGADSEEPSRQIK